MKRFILPAVLLVALAGAVLAAPDVPPVAPKPRPAPTKFVAPKLSNTLEVFVFANQRPVRIRVTALSEGKTLDETWRDRLKKAFDYFDRDGSGSLDAKEVGFVIPDQGLNRIFTDGVYAGGATDFPTLAKLDTDRDGRVSFEEFVASYVRSANGLLRPLPVQFDSAANTAVTEAIFKLMDANGDGKLTRDEVLAVEKLLATRDADEDECLNMQELAPNLYPQNFARRPVPVPPNGNPYPAPVGTQMVAVFLPGLVPGTITQQVIQRYDKDKDFELTKAECGFDDATFARLDTDKNGRLDGEELDVWRTGEPDVAMTLSLSSKATECVAKLTDERAAADRGFKLKQIESGRLVLHVGRQPIDIWAFAAVLQDRTGAIASPLRQQFANQFRQASAGKAFVEEKDLAGGNAVNFQFIRVIFESADRDADGKLTKVEFDAYMDLQDGFRNLGMVLTPAVQTPSLFQLLDENRDGRLGVRELRTAWNRLIVLEEPGAEVITKNVIQPSVSLRLTRSFDRNTFAVQPVQVGFVTDGGRVVPAPSRGPTWFRKMDRNADGDVSRTEFLGAKAEFDLIDTDHDDLISLEEAEAWDKKTRDKEAAKPER